jgi:hypothetical protein
MASTSSPLILTRVRRVATFVYGGTLFAVTKRLNDFLPVSYLLCMCWWQAEKRCTILTVTLTSDVTQCHRGVLKPRSVGFPDMYTHVICATMRLATRLPFL